MMEGDIRKKGMLYHQQQRFGKKWKKVWAEAVAESTHSLSCLELFEFSKSSMKESKKRAEGKVIVMQDLMDFLVITVATEAALRCKLYGEYILTPQSDSLILKDCKTKKVLLTWPYRFVRKFGQHMLIFNFEAGRRCESGEGYFEFVTNQSKDLFTVIEEALKNYPKVERSGTRPKEQHTQQSYTPPAQAKHSKKNLTSSLSLNTTNLSDISKKENINSTLSNVQDPVYAMINRPKVHLKSTKSSKNQQLGPDIECENIFGVLGLKEEADQMNPLKSAICTKCEDDEVYSEDKTCIVDEEKQLDQSMKQLSIRCTPNVNGAESVYSQVPDYYHNYGDNEESVDFVKDIFYPPCPNDTHSSNFEDFQDERFVTYDNLCRLKNV
ncbi:Docking protein 3 [Bagarius yarrelli]|uniref:Docking protein 3 n=1 Tax=Bagarius yarrelli TaxID=175774 RepID=A0A556U2R6_BAGYA|nr:Docking protein 3 [Bagarius yarrelli]